MSSLDLWPYLGQPGRLVQVPCTATEDVSRADRYVLETTVEGRQRAQVRPATPRSWSVSVPLGLGADLSGLEAFAWGAWGNGPWHWVSVQAQQGNLLTPRESLLLDRASVSGASIQDAGPVRVSDGSWAPRSVTVTIASGWVAMVRGLPVVPGMPFTFACDVEGSTPQVHVEFRDGAGGTISSHLGTGSGSNMQRVHATTTVPAGAVEAYVGVRANVTRAARPQATWTAGPVPFVPGHGCRSAVVDGLSSALKVIGPEGPLSSANFTVTEVA